MLSYVSSLNKLRSVRPEEPKLRFCEDLLKKAYDVIDKVGWQKMNLAYIGLAPVSYNHRG